MNDIKTFVDCMEECSKCLENEPNRFTVQKGNWTIIYNNGNCDVDNSSNIELCNLALKYSDEIFRQIVSNINSETRVKLLKLELSYVLTTFNTFIRNINNRGVFRPDIDDYDKMIKKFIDEYMKKYS